MDFRVCHLHHQIHHDSVTLSSSAASFVFSWSPQPVHPHQSTVSPALHPFVGRTDSCLSVAWDGHDCLQSLRRSQAEHHRTEAQRGFFSPHDATACRVSSLSRRGKLYRYFRVASSALQPCVGVWVSGVILSSASSSFALLSYWRSLPAIVFLFLLFCCNYPCWRAWRGDEYYGFIIF